MSSSDSGSEEAPAAPPRSVLAWLAEREAGTTPTARPYSRAPPRLRFPILSLVDEGRRLLSSVLLGYSGDGRRLFAYSTAPGGCHTLLVFAFAEPSRLLASVPLFRDGAGCHRGSQPAFTGLESPPLLISTAESPDGSMLVVHGEEGPLGEEDEDTRVGLVTALPWPHDGCSAAVLAFHFSYRSSCSPCEPFCASRSLLCGDAGEGALLALPSADGLLVVSLQPADNAGAGAAAPAGHAASCGAVVEGATRSAVLFSHTLGAELGGGGLGAAPTPSALCLVPRICGRFSAEMYARRALSAALAGGFSLTDARCGLVASAPGDGAAAACAVLQVLATLRRRDGGAAPPVARAVELLAALQLGGSRSGAAALLRARELTAVTAAGLAPLARDRLPGLRRLAAKRCRLGPAAHPHALSNEALLSRWRSAESITHPLLPLAILGFAVEVG